MPFKIVQTHEGGKLMLSVVPNGWEKDGTLYWPRGTNIKISDENSRPEIG